MRLEQRSVTPTMAQNYLNKTHFGRKVNVNRVAEYLQKMKEGRWRSNPAEPIALTGDGEILNGYHRMEAQARNDRPINFWFVVDVDKRFFDVIDQGKTRTAADVLSIAGIKNACNISAIIRRKYVLDNRIKVRGDGAENTIHLGKDEYIPEYKKSASLYDEFVSYSRSLYKRHKVLKVAELGGIMAHLVLTKQHSLDDVERFFDYTFESSPNKMFTQLRGILTGLAIERKTAKRGQYMSNIIARTWNAFLRNRCIKLRSTDEEIVAFD